jgi:hypothetical protein
MSIDDFIIREIKKLKADLARMKTHEVPGTVNAVTGGLVPPYPGGTVGYYRADGNWGTPATSANIGTIFTEPGQIIYSSGTGTASVLGGTTAGFALLTGGSGTPPYWGSAPAAVVADNSVTFAKIQDIAASKFIGRQTAGTGDSTQLSLTGSDGAYVNWAVAGGTIYVGLTAGAVAFDRLEDSVSHTILAREGTTTGAVSDVTLIGSGGVVVNWGNVDGTVYIDLPAGSVALDRLANINTNVLLGRDTASAGTVEELSIGGGIEWTGSKGIQLSAFGGDVTKTAGGTATTLVVAALKGLTTDSGAGTATANLLQIVGGEGIDTSGAGTAITITGEDCTSTNKGIGAFGTADFTVTNGTVAMVAGGHPFTWLTAALTSTSFDGDAFSTTAKTVMDLSALYSVPAGVKAVFVEMQARDSASAAGTASIRLGPSDTANAGPAILSLTGEPNDTYRAIVTHVPCNVDGDIYYQVVASGTATLDAIIRIWGYQT